MAEEGIQPRHILVSGGGIRNPLWLQIVADVCNLDLVVPDQENGASYGDAFLAARWGGSFSTTFPISQWVKPKRSSGPSRRDPPALCGILPHFPRALPQHPGVDAPA